MSTHVRRSKWRLYATNGAFFLGIVMFCYFTIEANPLAAGIAAVAAAAFMALHIYYTDRYKR